MTTESLALYSIISSKPARGSSTSTESFFTVSAEAIVSLTFTRLSTRRVVSANVSLGIVGDVGSSLVVS